METFDNYVFFHICEHTLRIFDTSDFGTYMGYCSKMVATLELDAFNKNDLSTLREILENIKLIFGVEDIIGFVYIRRFFIEGRFRVFEYPIRMLKEYHGFSFN